MQVGDWEIAPQLVVGVADVAVVIPVYAEATIVVLAPAPDRAVFDDGTGVRSAGDH